ncbi:hypothetical protein MAHJHV50_49440 [Mycobacterium avium subsp. hominissuis]
MRVGQPVTAQTVLGELLPDPHHRPDGLVAGAQPAGLLAGRPVVSVAHPGGLRTSYEPVRAVVRSPPGCATDTTGRPASSPANTTVPAPAAYTG